MCVQYLDLLSNYLGYKKIQMYNKRPGFLLEIASDKINHK